MDLHPRHGLASRPQIHEAVLAGCEDAVAHAGDDGEGGVGGRVEREGVAREGAGGVGPEGQVLDAAGKELGGFVEEEVFEGGDWVEQQGRLAQDALEVPV